MPDEVLVEAHCFKVHEDCCPRAVEMPAVFLQQRSQDFGNISNSKSPRLLMVKENLEDQN